MNYIILSIFIVEGDMFGFVYSYSVQTIGCARLITRM